MKNTILPIILLISGFSFSQKNDSIPERKFQDIFVCQCCEDTITLKAGAKSQYECTFYKTELTLICRKKDKTKWKIDLKDKLCDKALPYSCIMYGRGQKTQEEIMVVDTKGKIVMRTM